jgi:hypothetical protein
MDGSTSESFAFVNLEVCGVCCQGQMTEVLRGQRGFVRNYSYGEI